MQINKIFRNSYFFDILWYSFSFPKNTSHIHIIHLMNKSNSSSTVTNCIHLNWFEKFIYFYYEKCTLIHTHVLSTLIYGYKKLISSIIGSFPKLKDLYLKLASRDLSPKEIHDNFPEWNAVRSTLQDVPRLNIHFSRSLFEHPFDRWLHFNNQWAILRMLDVQWEQTFGLHRKIRMLNF